MSERPSFRKERLYFSCPGPEEVGDPERYKFLTGQIIVGLFLEPSLSFSRKCWGDFLWKMWHSSEPKEEGGYDDLDILLTIEFLQKHLTTFGLATSDEVKAVREGSRIEVIDPAPKYIPYKELLEKANGWKRGGKIIGLTHGSFDPPHVGHAGNFYEAYAYCDIFLVGFDTNTLIRIRKGKQSGDRPRFPELAWRMWEIASLPTVDYVFLVPIDSPGPESYKKLYKDLGISILAAGRNNRNASEYKRMMKIRGGHFIGTNTDDGSWSSTRLIQELGDEVTQKRHLHSVERVKKWAQKHEEVARQAGFLRDLEV